jgi:tetratricopeptide (TPR) repeat protein
MRTNRTNLAGQVGVLLSLAALPAVLAGQQAGLPPGVEAISLLGDTLRAPKLGAATEARLMQQLAAAEIEYERDPGSAEAAIWFGRRTAYLGRYRDAIGILSVGIAKHPDDARLYRHRGHRYITTRRLDRAIDDLLYAALLTRRQKDEVEPDGQPNARNIPVSTLQSNIWYHLALAYYLKGDLRHALDAWRQDLRLATNDDMRVATTHWLYMTLRRMGRKAEADAVLKPIRRDMDLIENQSYHRLLLLYKGELSPDSLTAGGDPDPALQDATVSYGVGNWHWYNGRRDEAMAIWRRILATGPWASFGYIAAEAELGRNK